MQHILDPTTGSISIPDHLGLAASESASGLSLWSEFNETSESLASWAASAETFSMTTTVIWSSRLRFLSSSVCQTIVTKGRKLYIVEHYDLEPTYLSTSGCQHSSGSCMCPPSHDTSTTRPLSSAQFPAPHSPPPLLYHQVTALEYPYVTALLQDQTIDSQLRASK